MSIYSHSTICGLALVFALAGAFAVFVLMGGDNATEADLIVQTGSVIRDSTIPDNTFTIQDDYVHIPVREWNRIESGLRILYEQATGFVANRRPKQVPAELEECPKVNWGGSCRPPQNTSVHLEFDGAEWHETARVQ